MAISFQNRLKKQEKNENFIYKFDSSGQIDKQNITSLKNVVNRYFIAIGKNYGVLNKSIYYVYEDYWSLIRG